MTNRTSSWGAISLALCMTFAAMFAAEAVTAATITTNGNSRWSQLSAAKGDTVIVRDGNTLTVNVGDLYGNSVCSALTVDGVLQFGTDAYNEAANLIVYGSLVNNGLITPSTDTSFSVSNSFEIQIVGGSFTNVGHFVPEVYNGSGTENEQVYLGLSGSSSMSVANGTVINDLIISGPTVLSGVVDCDRLYLYGKLQRAGGSVVIDNNGTVYRDDTGSISFAPFFNGAVNVSYSTSGELVTGPELDSVVHTFAFDHDIVLGKSVTVTGSVDGDQYANNGRNYIHTGSDTLKMSGDAKMNYVGVDGNLSRVYSATDSLLFPMIGKEGPIAIGNIPYDSLGSYVPRPIAIRLNNLSVGQSDTITVAFHDTLMKPVALPAGVVGLERQHYWSVGASQNYAGSVDANISLTWYNETYYPGFVMRRDLVNAETRITILRGDAATGVWTTADRSFGVAGPVYNADMQVTGGPFKSFGDFTTGELAGVPNGDFETWNGGNPVDWLTDNSVYNTPVNQSSDAFSGSSAVEGSTIGGGVGALAPEIRLVLPTEQIPGALEGHYQFNPSGNDKLDVTVKAYKDSEVVAGGTFVDSISTGSYQSFKADIQRVAGKSDSLTDSLTVEVALLPGDSAVYHAGTTFLVDDFTFGQATVVATRHPGVPAKFQLYQNYPNPFNPSTTIRFDLKKTSSVTLEIYNVLGQRVEYWNYGKMESGRYKKVIDMSRFASGVYFYRIVAEGTSGQRFVAVKKLVLVK